MGNTTWTRMIIKNRLAIQFSDLSDSQYKKKNKYHINIKYYDHKENERKSKKTQD